jgi:hypothetical protein
VVRNGSIWQRGRLAPSGSRVDRQAPAGVYAEQYAPVAGPGARRHATVPSASSTFQQRLHVCRGGEGVPLDVVATLE